MPQTPPTRTGGPSGMIAAVHAVEIGPLTIGGSRPFVLIAGPCVIESESHALGLAHAIKAIAARCGVP